MVGENSENKTKSSQYDSQNDPWASLYDTVRSSINQEYEDDKDFIQSKQKRPIEYSEDDAKRDLAAREEVRDNKLKEIDNLSTKLESMENRTDQDYFNDFSGETHFNAKTNKMRTYSDQDLYPPEQYYDENGIRTDQESTKEWGERRVYRNDIATLTEYIPMLPDESAEHYSKRIAKTHEDFPRQDGESIQEYKERIAEANDNNELLLDVAKKMPDSDGQVSQQLTDDLKNIEEMYQNGRFDEERKKDLEREVLEKAIHNSWDNEQKKTRNEKHAALKNEDKEKKRLEELQKTLLEKKAELEQCLKELYKEKQDRLDEINKELGPLTAINANFAHDKKELAHDFAEQELNADNAKSNIIKRIWKGNLFKKYYEKKYEREIMEGKREVNVDGEKMSLEQVIKNRSDSAIERFTLAATDEYGQAYIHDKAGETMSEADQHTTKIVRNAIEKFAGAKVPEEGDLDKITRDFGNDIRELIADGNDNGEPLNETLINNYLDVAKQARMRAEHGISMERVMEGFKVYNAEVRNNVRTAAHRDKLDSLINKIESSKLGMVLPSEVIAGAVGTAFALTQTGVRAATGVIGGIGASGIFAGLKERNRVTEDRTRMLRDAAINLSYESGDATRASRKRSRYEAKLGGTIYDTRPATELAENLNKAMEEGDSNTILRTIAEARVRVDYSDSESKDLICYSSADKLGDERTRLDIALIRAERSLSDEDKSKLQSLKETIQNELQESIDKNDADFRKIRTAQALKRAGKTVLIGSAFFLGSQEVIATLDPNKIGLLEKTGALEKLGIRTPENTGEATETLLAGLAGPRVETRVHTTDPITLRGDQQTEIERLEQMGYEKQLVSKGTTTTTNKVVEIHPANSTHALKVNTSFANNGTKLADGNELGLHLENGRYVAKLSGSSTMGDQTFNYEQLANVGRIKGHINIGGATFEVQSTVDPSGQIAWPIDAGGNITTTTGETIHAFGDNGEKLFKAFRVVADNGADADGIKQVVSLAADAGSDSFTGTISQVVPTTVNTHDVYELVKTTVSQIPRTGGTVSFSGGIVPPVFNSRVGLGEARPTPGPSDETTITEQPPEQNSETYAPQAPTTAPEQATEQPSEQISETPPDSDTTEIRNNFLGLIGEEGVGFMTDTREPSEEYSDIIGDWWDKLSEENRNRILDYENTHRNSNSGKGLRAYLGTQGVLS